VYATGAAGENEAVPDKGTSLEDPVSAFEATAGQSRVQDDCEAAGAGAVLRALSTAELGVPFAVHVLVTKTAILVDGELVVELESGDGGAPEVPEALREGYLVTALFERLEQKRASQEMIDHLVGRTGTHGSRLVATFDEDTPFRLLTQVLYSAGQAQIARFSLVVENPWLKQATVLHSELPSIGMPQPVEDEAPRPPLNLTVLVDGGGLHLTYAGGLEDSPRSLSCLSGLSCSSIEDYDWPGLHAALVEVSSAYNALWPDADPERNIIVVARSDVAFEIIARVLDTARWDAIAPSPEQATGEAASESRSAWKAWRTLRQLLLPHVVVAGGVD